MTVPVWNKEKWKEENDLAFMLPLTQDLELGFSKYNWHKGDAYDYDAFYEAANSDMDIFLCVQTGKYYIPSDNELLIYDDCFITYKN